jgi:GT2 family glycosyltransferase
MDKETNHQDTIRSNKKTHKDHTIGNLNVSIVRFEQPFGMIASLVALLTASTVVQTIYLIDNSATDEPKFLSLPIQYIKNNHNIGFGRAHNIALKKSINNNTSFHAVINPDVTFEPEILHKIIDFMQQNPTVGALMPKVFYPNGDIQYLCKLLPAPVDLLLKRFFPKQLIAKRMNQFQLKESGYNKILNVPYLSGCFMVLRMQAIKEVGLFDEQFFLYPEDIDLARRIHEHYETIFYPYVSIVHTHEQGSYKNLKLLIIHVINMIRYFNKWGWINDKQRKQINRQTLNQIFTLKHQNTLS